MLVRLFSETKLLLKDVTFNPGINIILGKYSEDREASGINGIGKSTLVRLISYLFLSDSSENIFDKTKYNFLREEKHNVILEFKIGEQSYFIKRQFDKNNDVSFGTDINNLENYTKAELKTILLNKLFPVESDRVFLEGRRFGTLMHFFIKDDIAHQQRIDPLNFLPYVPTARELAIYNFFLLNLPTKNLIMYDDSVSEYNNYHDTINTLEDKIFQDTGKKVEEYKSDRIKIEEKITVLNKSLKDYKFLERYKGTEEHLVDVTSKINTKLKNYYALNTELKKIKESFQLEDNIDTEEIGKLYNEVRAAFGDLVQKTLDEISSFKKEIIENRNKFFVNKELQLQRAVDKILDEISHLEQGRSDLYKTLDEKGALDSLTNTYEQLVVERTSFESNLQILKQIDEMQDKVSNLDVKISEVKRDMLNDLKQFQTSLDGLRALFQDVLKNAIFLGEDFSEAYFDVPLRPKSSRNQLPLTIEIKIPRADALGQSRLKIVAYDLMVFLNNINTARQFPQFLVHDGVFHGIAKRTMVNTLNYIFHYQLKHPQFQYIVTFNEDEIEVPRDKEAAYGKLEFDKTNLVIAEYEDTPAKMIFKRAFR